MNKNTAGTLIVSFAGAVFAARGLHAIWTQHYQSTGKYGGTIFLTGEAAIWAGVAWLFLAAVIVSGKFWGRDRGGKRAIVIGLALAFCAIVCFWKANGWPFFF